MIRIRKRAILAAVVMGVGLVGCASNSLQVTDMAQKTIVKAGEVNSLPSNEKITYIKAGEPFTIQVKIGGDIFMAEKSTSLVVRLKEDAYLYFADGKKDAWVSRDKKKWHRIFDMVRGRMSLLGAYNKEGVFEGNLGLVLNTRK